MNKNLIVCILSALCVCVLALSFAGCKSEVEDYNSSSKTEENNQNSSDGEIILDNDVSDASYVSNTTTSKGSSSIKGQANNSVSSSFEVGQDVIIDFGDDYEDSNTSVNKNSSKSNSTSITSSSKNNSSNVSSSNNVSKDTTTSTTNDGWTGDYIIPQK